MPTRLADAWVAQDAGLQRPVNEAADSALAQLAERIARWQITPTGSEGYRKAEVTAGGVDTRELSSQTMESKRQPGLYFIGEVVDVTGWLGGYNFQWAWASAAACAQALEPEAVRRYNVRLSAGLPSTAPTKSFQLRNPAGARSSPGQIRQNHQSMTTIRVKENEPFDVALRRFKRTIEKLGLLTDLRAREFYEKPTAERKRKKAAAVKRHYKRVRSMQLPKKLY